MASGSTAEGTTADLDKLRILFIGKRFYTNKDALEERFGRIYQLPLHWTRDGAEVQLWLVDYHTRESRKAMDGALRIVSTPLFSWASLRALGSACLRLRPQVVVASGDCYIGLLGWLAAAMCRARFVFDIYDKYDEFGAYRRVAGFDLFGFLRRRAARLFFASASLARALASRSPESDAVVPNGVDEALFRPMLLQACRARLDLPATPRMVGYFGSMEPVRGVSDLVQAIKQLRDEGGDVRLLLCGRADAGVFLGFDWIIYRGLVRHAEVPAYINACDVVTIPYRSSLLLDHAASCKIAEYLMCQRPLVSTRSPNFLENFPVQAQQLGAGLCTPGDASDLARAVGHQLRAQLVMPPVSEMSWERIAGHALYVLRLVVLTRAA